MLSAADASGDLNMNDSNALDLDDSITDDLKLTRQLEQNTAYITSLLSNLEQTLDKYNITGSMPTRRRAYNILQQVKRLSMDAALTDRAERIIKRSGMSLKVSPVEEVPHVPATEQQSTSRKQRVGFGNEDRDNNDRRFKNLYTQSDNYSVDSTIRQTVKVLLVMNIMPQTFELSH